MSKKKAKIAPELLRAVTEFKKRKVERYYYTVIYTLSLKEYFRQHRSPRVDFIGAELKLSNGSNYVRPDVVLQAENETVAGAIVGLPMEVKTSISDERDIRNELNKLKRYDQQLSGWKTPGQQVSDHAIIFSPYYEDSSRVKSVLTQDLNSGTLVFGKQLVIWEWNFVMSPRTGKDEIIVRQIHGSLLPCGLPSLHRLLEVQSIKMDTSTIEFGTMFEGEFFTRQEPPTEYVIEQLWNKVFSRLCVQGNSVISSRVICQFIKHNFPLELLRDANGNSSGVPITWIDKSLMLMTRIGLATQHTNGYEILFDKKIKKDFSQFVCESLAKRQIIDSSDGKVNRIVAEHTGTQSLQVFAQGQVEFK